jgi:hypothetical protein
VEVAARFGWGPAFSLLALGPALGIVAMVRLKDARGPANSQPLSASRPRTAAP